MARWSPLDVWGHGNLIRLASHLELNLGPRPFDSGLLFFHNPHCLSDPFLLGSWVTLGLMCVCVLSHFSRVLLFVIPRTVILQLPLSMGFSSQEYWSGLPRPPPGDLPNPGIEPMSFTFPALAGGFFTTSATCSTRPSMQRVSESRNCCQYYFLKSEAFLSSPDPTAQSRDFWAQHVGCAQPDAFPT